MPYAIAFDMKVEELKQHYGEPYNTAYKEIERELSVFGFEWTQGSLYIEQNEGNNLVKVYQAINRLGQIEWFKKSVRDLRTFKVEDWSDFTDIIKNS